VYDASAETTVPSTVQFWKTLSDLGVAVTMNCGLRGGRGEHTGRAVGERELPRAGLWSCRNLQGAGPEQAVAASLRGRDASDLFRISRSDPCLRRSGPIRSFR
jgi:hypothetical protein